MTPLWLFSLLLLKPDTAPIFTNLGSNDEALDVIAPEAKG